VCRRIDQPADAVACGDAARVLATGRAVTANAVELSRFLSLSIRNGEGLARDGDARGDDSWPVGRTRRLRPSGIGEHGPYGLHVSAVVW